MSRKLRAFSCELRVGQLTIDQLLRINVTGNKCALVVSLLCFTSSFLKRTYTAEKLQASRKLLAAH
jgi:hypothetical protein